jgi:undecaprenyl-diphosphatase
MENEYLNALILGIVEGLTEFLPVSSTGHLILGGELLGFTGEGSVAFKIAIQLGAILAVVVAYWRRFLGVAVGVTRGQRDALIFVRNITLAFLPAMVIGVFAYEAIRAAIQTPMVVAVALIVGGVAILLIERMVKRVRMERIEDISALSAGAVGLFQCIAMIPGVSRSGATIMGSLLIGVERKTAAEFSFFLAVPTMAAATAYALFKERALLDTADMTSIWIGFGAAFVVALFVVKAFVAVVGRYGFAPFAWYRIALGSVSMAWLLMR